MKKFSSKKSVQIIAHLLQEYGIADVVISPGSRNAPLAIQFGEGDAFNSFSVVDERSAAFVALGMSKSTKKPTAITCTSGSAAANYYPAITEAFYANVPLLVLTADRPEDYVDIFDGQTIRQKNLFQQHSYGDFQLMDDSETNADEYNFETVKKAIELCIEKQGPVHINIPLSEPLYDLVTELPFFPSVEKIQQKTNYEIPSKLVAEWNTSQRILILAGTLEQSPELESLLSQLVKNHSAVVLIEANSNLNHPKFFSHIDRYISGFSDDDFKTYKPDLLITIGQNVVSKKVKQFLRKASPANHWHIDSYWHPDTYYCLNEKVKCSPEEFFKQLVNRIQLEPRAYYNLWETIRYKRDARHEEYCLNFADFSDFYCYWLLSQKIPSAFNVHFSNSSAIRYAQLFDFQKNKIYCNRGTSGIDGSTSTAIGFAIKNPQPTLLITGDLSFLYDVNGLWNDYIPPYTRIIVVNNGEGNIFHIIPGPSNANENIVDEFIATKHQKTAEHLAKHFGFEYVKVENDNAMLERVVDHFFSPSPKPKILEINTSSVDNAQTLKRYFEFLDDK